VAVEGSLGLSSSPTCVQNEKRVLTSNAAGTRRFFVRTQSWKLYNNGKLYHIPRDINEKSPVALNRAPKSAAADIRLLQQAIATIDDGHAFPNRTKK